MWLKFLGVYGPNGERKDEVREYTDEEAEYWLRMWPTHFVKASEDEIPAKNNRRKKLE